MRFSLLISALAVFAIAGCGSNEPKLAPVRGTVVLLNGQTVTHGYVNLYPDAAKGNRSNDVHHGQIKDGVFTVMTGASEGAPVGHYRIAIEAAKDVDPNNPYITTWLAEEKYTDPTRSGLAMEVVATPEPGRYDYKLEPHSKKQRR